MPKLTETFANRISPAKRGTDKYWDSEIKGLVLFVGKKSKTWYFQKDVGQEMCYCLTDDGKPVRQGPLPRSFAYLDGIFYALMITTRLRQTESLIIVE